MKCMMENLGSNINRKQCREIVGKSLGTVKHICAIFEKEADVHENKEYHTIPSFPKDLKSVTAALIANQVFECERSQALMITSYRKLPVN